MCGFSSGNSLCEHGEQHTRDDRRKGRFRQWKVASYRPGAGSLAAIEQDKRARCPEEFRPGEVSFTGMLEKT